MLPRPWLMIAPLLLLPRLAFGVCLDGLCTEGCRSTNNACLVWMAGGGSTTADDIRARQANLRTRLGAAAEVVAFSPSSPAGYSDADILEIQEFLSERRSLGPKLNFLISSIAAGPFEEEIYASAFLPPRIGAVLLAQPFSPGATRPVLPAEVKPLIYAVYDIQLPELLRRTVAAGPSAFEDPTVEAWHIVLRRVPPSNLIAESALLGCLHSRTVGPSEDLATSVLRQVIVEGDLRKALRTLARQEKLRGGVAEDIAAACGGRPPSYPDLVGVYTVTGRDTWRGCLDPIYNRSYDWHGTLNIYRQSSGNLNARTRLNGEVFGLDLVSETQAAAILRNATATRAKLQGTFLEDFFIEGELDSRSTGVFSGTRTRNGVRWNASGDDFEGDTCTYSGSWIGVRRK